MEKSEREYLNSIAPECARIWAGFTPSMRSAFRKLHRSNHISHKTVPTRTINALLKRRVVFRSRHIYSTRKPETVYVPTMTGCELLGWLKLTRQLTRDRDERELKKTQ